MLWQQGNSQPSVSLVFLLFDSLKSSISYHTVTKKACVQLLGHEIRYYSFVGKFKILANWYIESVILTLNSSLTSKCQLSALILRVECGTAEIFVFQLVSASTNATLLAILHCKDSFTHAKNIIVFFARYKVWNTKTFRITAEDLFITVW